MTSSDINDINDIQVLASHPMGIVMLEAFVLCLKKNKDYGTQEEIFANFMGSDVLGVVPSVGCAIRLGDKYQRFTKGVRTNWQMAVDDELMEDTIKDMINYLTIYWCLYKLETESRLLPG